MAATSLPAAASTTMSAVFRPHSFRVEVPGTARDPRCAWMDGIVEESEFLGESTRYRVRVGPHSLAVDQGHTTGMNKFPVGAAVSLGLDPTQVRLFAT
jgi:iron(III) transport system ATP-binding protein